MALLVEALRYKSEVVGSIPDDVIGICHRHNPSAAIWPWGRLMSFRNISWGLKAAGALGRQPYHLHESIVLNSGTLRTLPYTATSRCAFLPGLGTSLFSLCVLNQDTRCFTRSTVNVLQLCSIIA